MENINTLTLGEIVRRNYRAAAVFEKFSLDFCCRGNQRFADACREGDVSADVVEAELQAIQTGEGDGVNFDSWPMNLLVDYIVKRHHAYIEERSPRIKGYLDKICRVHSGSHPELNEIRTIFFEVAGGMAVHMKKEELMLFPFIKKLELTKDTKMPVQSKLFKSVESPVEMMKVDHTEEGEKLRRIADLSGGYKVPADGCRSFSVTYELLNEFEKDLHIHIHLENNILFPRAIQLEKELNGAVS